MPPNEIESVWPPDADPWSATTPGASKVRSRKSRVFNGSDAICCVSTSVRTTFSVVSTSGACSVTVIVSSRPPTSRVNGATSCELMASRRSARLASLKPVSAALTV